MSKRNSLQGWLKPASATTINATKPPSPAPQKRKRTAITAPVDSPDSESDTQSTKKQKVIKKSTVKKAPTKKAPTGNKAAEQLYKKIIGDVDKKVSGLDARVKKMGPNSRAITSDTYAEAMVNFAKDVRKLMALDARFAFNLLLYIGPHAHGDLEASFGMSGYGGTEGPFEELDEVMLEVIALRDDIPSSSNDHVSLPEVRHRWTRDDAEVGEFKTGRPNKQQRGQIERQKAEWIKERNIEARARREKVEDWISNAIEELKGEQAAISPYGLEGYFKKSISRLEEPKGGKGVVLEAAGDAKKCDGESE
jgi:hypothetical protein